MPPTESQIVATLLAGAIGDAVGAYAEGHPSPALPDVDAPLYITDDTQLTLATVESIIEHRQVLPEKIADNFTRWYRQRRFTGLGSSTLKALRELDAGGHWATVGAVGERAAGNGAAMRIAPLAFFLDPDDDHHRRTIRDVCRITHRHDEAYIGALAMLHAIRFSLNEGAPSSMLLQQLFRQLPDSIVRDRFRIIVEESLSPREYAERFSASGYVADSVPLAILSAVSFPTLDSLLTEIIWLGGDTDSNASMASQLLGAAHGLESLPHHRLTHLDQAEQIQHTAHNLARVLTNR